MKKAFSLVELLVVIGIMGMMATLAISSYTSLTRGMNDRAALDLGKSVAEAALQRAKLDRKNTYLYLFDEVIKLDSEMSAGIVAGVAIAVRPIGRITMVPESGLFCDEFGDLNQTFGTRDAEGEEKSEAEKEAEASAMRLYNIRTKGFATVIEGVYEKTVMLKDLADGTSGGTQHELTVYGFKKVNGDEFKVGDLYGQEFVVTRLPPGYTFGSSVNMSGTSSLGMKQVGSPIEIKPTDSSAPSVPIYMRKPNGMFEQIGKTSETKDGE